MKTTHFALLLLVGFLLTNCVAIRRTDFSRTEGFNPQATFKVIAINSNDPALGMMEQQLTAKGLRVISENILRVALPGGNVMMTAFDTAYSYQQYHPVSIELFEAKPADYLIRYSRVYSTLGDRFIQFNATVIDSRTGVVEFTYTFRQGYGLFKKPARQVISDFVEKMYNR